MGKKVHIFENGVKVYDYHLLPLQRERYKLRNVHEAEEEDVFMQIIQSIHPDGCYFNIGSAIGYYSLFAKRLAPGLIIHAIEPLKRHREYFIENIILNGFKESDFTIHTEGVSSSNGEQEFLDNSYGSSIQQSNKQSNNKKDRSLKSIINNILVFLKIRKPKEIITIKTKTLDEILSKFEQPIDLCQMDVQGHEVAVLKGAQKTLQMGNVKTFLIGTHSRKLHQDCIDLLMKNSYVVEFEEYDTKTQPDGILVASKGTKALTTPQNKP